MLSLRQSKLFHSTLRRRLTLSNLRRLHITEDENPKSSEPSDSASEAALPTRVSALEENVSCLNLKFSIMESRVDSKFKLLLKDLSQLATKEAINNLELKLGLLSKDLSQTATKEELNKFNTEIRSEIHAVKTEIKTATNIQDHTACVVVLLGGNPYAHFAVS